MKTKKAVFICGSGGSGKSTVAKEWFSDYVIVDLDLIYEQQLNDMGLGLRIVDFNEDQKKVAQILFEKSKSLNDEKFNKTVENGENIVIDSIGRDLEVILHQRSYLEKMGYVTFMIMVYSELETCLKRVDNRDRVYNENVTIDSWYLSYGNISDFKKEFNDRFVLIYNEDFNRKEKIDVFINEYNNKKDII
jgi:dephospho-CoA kinase